MKDYLRKVNYYETDKMGITHHSNYIRWMEEARTDFLEQLGYGYVRFEAEGLVSPVVGLECQYKQTTTFGDDLRIATTIEKYSGAKLTFGYEIVNAATGDIVFLGKSVHCFLDESGRPVSLKKRAPEFDAVLKANITV